MGSRPSEPAAAGDDDADVAVLDAVDRQGVLDGAGHLGLGHGDGQQDGLGRVPEPIEVGLHAEDLAAVAADALEHAVAVQQTVVVDADLGVLFGVELAVDIDFERHDSLKRPPGHPPAGPCGRPPRRWPGRA